MAESLAYSCESECSIHDLTPYLSAALHDQGHDHDDGEVLRSFTDKEGLLMLAAEAGKALLEEKQELAATNDQLVGKIDELEENSYHLQQCLKKVKLEYESRLEEFQRQYEDLEQERDQHQDQLQHHLARLQDQRHALDHLHQEKGELCRQLEEAGGREGELEEKISCLSKDVSEGRQCVQQLEAEIDAERENFVKKREAMEKTLHVLKHERELLECRLEKTDVNLHALQQQKEEADRQHREEVRQLQDTIDQLQEEGRHEGQRSISCENSLPLLNDTMQRKPTRTLNIGLVGPSKAGKSEFVKCLIKGNHFEGFGINGKCYIHGLLVIFRDQTVILNIREFRGDKDAQLFEALDHDLDAYFVFFDLSDQKSFTEVKYNWLPNLYDREPPAVVIANKADFQNAGSFQRKLPDVSEEAWKTGHLDISAITGHNVDDLLRRIIEMFI